MPTDRLAEGHLLEGRYEVLEIVGRGGMGTVYKARDRRLECFVAIKEMSRPALSDDDRETAVRQFEQEAKLLAQLTHPNLPRVSDYFVEGTRWYLILEFVVGMTLDRRLRHNGGAPQPIADVLAWGIQVADVLAYLHSQNPPIVFRDIKPANIMLQDDGTVRLIDFGIARRYQEGAEKDTLLYGSPGYSPPEQYGRSQTDPRSDLYALGATVHHLITGHDPAGSPFKFARLRSYDAALPPALEAVVSSCVEMDIEKRPTSAAEVRNALASVRNAITQPALAAASTEPRVTKGPRPAPLGPKIVSSRLAAVSRRRTARRIGAWTAAAAAVVLATAFGTRAVWKAHPRSQPRPRTAALPPKSVDDTGSAGAVSTPRTATLQVRTDPPGAVVMLDSRQVGITPCEVADIEPGRYDLRLSPPAQSGLVAATVPIEIDSGETLQVVTPLARATTSVIAPEHQLAANIVDIKDQAGTVRSALRPRLVRRGILVNVAFRLVGAAGKRGTAGLFLLDRESQQPLQPPQQSSAFTDQDGNLARFVQFTCATDPADFPDVEIFVPESAIPVPIARLAYRIVIFVDGVPVAQSPVRAFAQ